MSRPFASILAGIRMWTEDHARTVGGGAAARRWAGRGRVGALVGALIVILAGLVPLSLRAEPTAVQDIRVAPYGDGTRIVIDLNRRVSFRHLLLDSPPRLAIDLPEVAWQVPPASAGQTTDLVKSYRFGRFRPGVSRIVFDLAQPFEIRRVFELPPDDSGHGHRIVTDLGIAQDPATAAARPDAATTAGGADAVDGQQAQPLGAQPLGAMRAILPPPPKQSPEPPRTRIIVIDPGHGGIDPGAIGSGGTYEKDVVLAIGLELRRQLVATGRYQVVMTRDSDRIVRLRDRLEIAHESGGELFLSLHADSLVNAPDVRGASVYTLSERASNDEAARLASKENRADILAGIDLSNQEEIVTEILIDLAQRDANNKSIEVADLMVNELGSVTKMARLRRSQAGFVVLKSPDMPSVLVELGYLSNADDEQALRSSTHLAELAKGLVKAIDDYFAPAHT
jgi:N-acetylmuramoyl-L-alanine amidase